MSSQFSALDWAILAAYFILLALSGWWINRQASNNSQYYFTANRSIPTWVAAISVLATAQSAATFLGGPDMGFRSNLTYLATTLGALLAAIFVAYFLIPQFYQQRVSTVYELLEKRFSEGAKKSAGQMYLFGRVFANGARLYMASLAVSMILFTNIEPGNVIWSIVLLLVISLGYSVWGGIKSVMYGDVVQCVVYVSAALLVVVYLSFQIPADWSVIVNALQNPLDGGDSKLKLFDFKWDTSSSGVFNIYSTFAGFFLLYLASFGLDQDMTQRTLTCKSPRQASFAIIWSVLLAVPVMLILLILGFLLHIFYLRPDVMANGSAGAINTEFSGEKITVFMYYVLHEMPAGLRGFVTIGVISAAVSTLTSGLNSMSSVIIQDLYKPWQQNKQHRSESHYVLAGRLSMIFSATALALMAVLCYYWQRISDTPLLEFALGVMVFSYSGLLGVYAVAVFSKRGNTRTVNAALLGGFFCTLLLQPYAQRYYLPETMVFDLAFTWQLCIGFVLSWLICISGKPGSDAVGRSTQYKHALSALRDK